MQSSYASLFMKILRYVFLVLGLSMCLTLPTQAATVATTPKAVIDSPDTSEANKNVLFEAGRSTGTVKTTQYLWDFGDKSVGSGPDIFHTYSKPGRYTITLTINNGEISGDPIKSSKELFVYNQVQTLLVNNASNPTQINNLVNRLKQKNIYLHQLNFDRTWTPEDELLLHRSIFVFTYLHPAELVSDQKHDALSQNTLVIMSQENLQTLERLSRTSFSSIGAEKIILAPITAAEEDSETHQSILEASNLAELTGMLTNRKLSFVEVNTQQAIGIDNFMLAITNYLRSKGAPDWTLFLLLSIPLIATMISFARQFIGLATLGIYTPTVFTIIFLLIGGGTGSMTFIIIAIISILLQKLLNKVRIMYVPKLAMILMLTSMLILGILAGCAYFGFNSLITIEIFPVILLLTMGERFISLKLERGLKSASLLFAETIIVALVIYMILGHTREAILAYPEIIFLMIPLNYLIGKWTGLRLSEILRFRELVDTVEQDAEEE